MSALYSVCPYFTVVYTSLSPSSSSSSNFVIALWTSAFTIETGLANCVNLCCSSTVADGLSSGLLTRQRLMKSENSLLYSSVCFSVGGGFVGIMKIALCKEGRERQLCTLYIFAH